MDRCIVIAVVLVGKWMKLGTKNNTIWLLKNMPHKIKSWRRETIEMKGDKRSEGKTIQSRKKQGR
jgi:hypothetical protein